MKNYRYSKNLFNLSNRYNSNDYKPDRFYIAYGSNMSLSRLKSRCPNSEFVSTGVIEGYKLIFRKSASGFYASLDKVDYRKKKKRKSLWSVPVAIFKISKKDEENLDKFEGCPKWYKKIDLEVKDSQGDKIKGIGYVLPETSKIGVPSSEYYSIIAGAYKNLGISSDVLEKAFLVSYKKSDKVDTNVSFSRPSQISLFPNNYSSSYINPIKNSFSAGIRKYSEGYAFNNSEKFFREFQRELESIDISVYIELTKDVLSILDLDSGETYFIVYPPNGNTFYIENVMDNDFMDYASVEEAVFDIKSYFSNR